MPDRCNPSGYEQLFGPKEARRALRAYDRRGLNEMATTSTTAVGTTTTTLAPSSPTTTIAFAVAGTTTTTLGPLEAMATTTTDAGDATAASTPSGTPTSLPFTGQNATGMVLLAVLSLALGIGALRVGRQIATEPDGAERGER
jgi:hypothetical protein